MIYLFFCKKYLLIFLLLNIISDFFEMDLKAHWFPLATLALQGLLILMTVIGLGMNIAAYAYVNWTNDCEKSNFFFSLFKK